MSALCILALVGCDRVQPEVPSAGGEQEISFVIEDPEATRAPQVVESITGFNVTATYGTSGSETARWSNRPFSLDSATGQFRGGCVWPATDPGYHFYASNVTMADGAAGQSVVVNGIDTDVVCAYLATSTYRQTNSLVFNHVLSRVGTVNVSNVDGFTNVSLKMKYRDAGTLNIRTGAWSGLGSLKEKTLSLTADNNFWIVPGTYDLTLSFTDMAGSTVTKTVSQEFRSGLINNITPVLGENPDVVVSTREVYEAPAFTLGSIDDVPASGGTSGIPAVTDVQQMKHVEYTYADGHTSDGPSTPVTVSSYTVTYCRTASGSYSATCPTYSGDNLGTTEKARTALGDICVKVTANGATSSAKTTTVYQQANVKSTIGATESTTAFAIVLSPSNVKASGGPVSVTGTRSWSRTAVRYTYTSGAATGGEVTTGSTPMTSGFTVSASPATNITVSGTTLTVAANASTTSGRTWTITGACDGMSGNATLIQSRKSSWDVGGDDDGEGDPEHGDY